MRKNDLIKLLQNIKGNPEVVLWNGFVGDWQPISSNIETMKLYKQSKEFIAKMLDAECIRDGLELTEEVRQKNREDAKNSFKKYYKWELPNQYVTEDEYKEWYGKNVRSVIMLSAKSRGVSTFDRSGRTSY